MVTHDFNQQPQSKPTVKNTEVSNENKSFEAAARELCQLRGQDPDELEAYHNGTMAYTQQARWRNAQTELEYFVSMMHTINKHKLVEKSDG